MRNHSRTNQKFKRAFANSSGIFLKKTELLVSSGGFAVCSIHTR